MATALAFCNLKYNALRLDAEAALQYGAARELWTLITPVIANSASGSPER